MEYTEMAESVFKLETKAIDHLRKALESEGVKTKMTTTVNKKIISDVPVISWGNPGVCSFAAALEAAFKVTKHPYSYNEIMGDSALAFRVRWRGLECKKDGPWWCGSIPVAEFPDVTAGISEQTGWKFKDTGMLESQPEKIKDFIPDVIESINKGRPVVGYPTGKQLDCATIYGYEVKDGKVFFYWRNLYTGDKENIAPADNTGPWLLFMESWQKAPSAKKRFIASLKQSVINWYRAPSGNPTYYTWSYGKEAIEIWIDDLKKAEKYTDKERGELFFVNAWNFGTMRDARNNAVKYLDANIKLLPEKVAKKLDKALKLYKEEVKLFKTNPDAFKGPMNGKKATDWTASDRNRELQILQKALELENKAIVIIREALKAMDIEVKIKSPTGLPNVEKLNLKADRYTADTFSTTFSGVASFLGHKTSVQEVVALSGNAFTPGIDPAEECPGKWCWRGGDVAIKQLGEALGLEIVPMPQPPVPKFHGDWDNTKKVWAEERKQYIPVIKEYLNSGAVIVTESGWERKLPEYDNIYTWWGVITDAKDDGTVLGVTITNKKNSPMMWVGRCWAVYPAKKTLTSKKLTLATLKLALARIHSLESYAADNRKFGLKAIDLWADQFSHVPFCDDDCGAKAPGCPLSNAHAFYYSSITAAQYLKDAAKEFKGKTAKHLEKSAAHYDRIVKILKPYTVWKDGYEPIMGDKAKQEVHAREVILPLKIELATAGKEIAAALSNEGIKVDNIK